MKYYVVCHSIPKHAGAVIYVCDKVRSREADSKPADHSEDEENNTSFLTYFDSLDDAEKYRDLLVRFRDHYRLMYLLDKCCGSLSVDDV